MRVVEVEIPDSLSGERLDRVVAMVGDVTRAVAAELVDSGAVVVDGAVARRRADRLSSGQRLRVEVPLVEEEPLPQADASVRFVVVHEDDDVLVVDKPAGLVVHPGAGNVEGTLVHGLLARYPEIATVGEPFRPGIVHRLDRDTSGLMVVARTEVAHEMLVDALRARTVTRRYRTLVWGHIEENRGQIDAPIGRSMREPTKMAVVVGGREARTTYEVVQRYDLPVPCTELICHLETGRTHQIRVHLRAIDHPVVGDSRYGGARSPLPCPRQFLHAEHLAFAHPRSAAPMQFDTPLPADLVAVRAGLAAES